MYRGRVTPGSAKPWKRSLEGAQKIRSRRNIIAVSGTSDAGLYYSGYSGQAGSRSRRGAERRPSVREVDSNVLVMQQGLVTSDAV